jgi:hypothetical protein
MRAAAQPAAAKVLRVGLVYKGKVIDERVVAADGHVTIGPNERATFVLTGAGVPIGFRLFERSGGRTFLQITDSMSGRVASSAGVVDLAALRAHASAVQIPGAAGPIHRVRIDDDARGKIAVGEHTVLFQFVAPAPALGKPQLPVSVKSSLGDVDWRTSVIAAFSFLVHFGAVGSIYSDWTDPVVDDEAETTQILESVKQLPAPPPIEHPKDENATPSPTPSAQASAKPAQSSSSNGGGRVASTGNMGGNAGGAMSDARAHQLSSQMRALELDVLGSLNESRGSATGIVLSSAGDFPFGALDKAAASTTGVRAGVTGGLDLGGNTGAPIKPGAIPRLLIDAAPSTVTPITAGSAVAVKPPPGSVSVPPPVVSGGAVPNAGSVVAAMAAGFRRCYNNGLNHEDPTMRGTVRVTARIGPNGEVLSASASGGGTLSATVVGCVRNRVASAQFASPEGGGARLVIPVTLIPQ